MRAKRKIVLLATILTAFAAAPEARACGGFFCDSPPVGQPPMPVDQTGETVVFVFDGNQIEAHIQIQYSGDPERFAWLIPLQTVPEISVGSAQLFLNLLNGTVPTISVGSSADACNGRGARSSSSGGSGCGASSTPTSFSADDKASGGSGPTRTDKPVVQQRDQVGAFEVSIVSGSGANVETWLVDNGYLPDDEAPRIVDEYAAQGYVFAAIKLRAGAGIDELHPLIVKYRGSEPCIPLKLTRIAAKEDMAVRAFFLGERRTVPTSYRHVALNPARVDWTNLGSNYVELVTRAVDSPGADGRAFVTEYAGTSTAVSRIGLVSSSWDHIALVGIDAFGVVDELERQGLMSCSSASDCNAFHPQILPLLRNHLPPPGGVSEAAFWACTMCYANGFDPATFDSTAFSADMKKLIVDPGAHAQALLERWPYLTRLFTTLSPNEMTEDPMFAELPAGKSPGDVSPLLNATDRTTCDAKSVMNLANGREIAHAPGFWPQFDDHMPWAERVEEFGSDGSRIELKRDTSTIDDLIAVSNARFGYDPAAADRASLSQTDGGGCACQMRSVPGHGIAILLLGALGLFRRSRRVGKVAEVDCWFATKKSANVLSLIVNPRLFRPKAPRDGQRNSPAMDCRTWEKLRPGRKPRPR